PIENRADLENAVKAFGRAKDPDVAKAHIKKRAKALDAMDALPEDWVDGGSDDAAEKSKMLASMPGPKEKGKESDMELTDDQKKALAEAEADKAELNRRRALDLKFAGD